MRAFHAFPAFAWRAFFKTKAFAGRISGNGFGVVKDAAKINEMGLRG